MNAEITYISYDGKEVHIKPDQGKTWVLDSQCVNIQNPKVGMRGQLQYQEYEYGCRYFFNPNQEE